ncbi:hypothetical protein F5X68DRAFT_215830 [Plectosphaerella plurivora]|uniref:Uncharacterized protein n=1 Tax=Plectosphaerella plurivora TaxID=936078 RepID=A0A9P9A6J5_9PEZI|nr:hypothetical protein F5X68DRAFT_215830 [Plectosphaerella plurivora]
MHIPIRSQGGWSAGSQLPSSQGCIDSSSAPCTHPTTSFSILASLWRSISSAASLSTDSISHLRARDNPASSVGRTNTIVGIVLGIVLGLFVVGVCAFVYNYRDSLRRIRKKHRHKRHRSTSSKSSKSSRSSRGAAEAPPPPHPPPPPPPPPAAPAPAAAPEGA